MSGEVDVADGVPVIGGIDSGQPLIKAEITAKVAAGCPSSNQRNDERMD